MIVFPRRQRCGTVLIVTILVSFALAGTVVALCQSMRVERLAAANQGASVQVSAIQRGAEQYVLALLAEQRDTVEDLPENDFAAIQLGEGYFWILRPDYDDPDLPLFGLVGEASKLNLNSASYDQIMRLPGMLEDIGSAIMEWKDEDETVERTGPESEYYLSLPEPYYSKNANFETVEELLMLRDVTRPMLYGDGTAPPLGTPASAIQRSSGGSFLTDPMLARGWYDLLTVYSAEANTTADGQQRINVNRNSQRTQLRDRLRSRLTQSRADAILAALGTRDVRDLFDFYFRCNLTPDEFDQIYDDLTTTTNQTLTGRINVNTAPRAVLDCITGLEPADVDKLIAQRRTANSNGLSWVVEALGQRAVGIGGQITTRSAQYTADILAVSGNGRAYKRCRIVVDMRQGTPQIVYRRDVTDRGWPMDEQILAALRAGQGAGNWGGGSLSTFGGGF